jgi:DNA-binding protein YbaB
VTVAIGQNSNSRDNRRTSNAQLIQLGDEAGEKRGLQATPRDDDTFLNVEKGCLFLLTADLLAALRDAELTIRRRNVPVD